MIFKSLLTALFILVSYNKCGLSKTQPLQNKTCDTDYALNELYYSASAKLTINLAYHWLSDTIGEINLKDIDSSVQILNMAIEAANIKFEVISIKEHVTDAKHDMPSYVKTAKALNNKNAINIYIYGDKQENFSDVKYYVLGAAGGIPSTFFAIRRSYICSSTLIHEALHTLGLYHVDTYDPDETGSSSRTGDKVCDTPSAINLIEKVTEGCIFIGNESYTEEQLDVITCNIMSNIHTQCRGCITDDQIQRIKWVMEQSSDLRATIKSPKIEQ